MRRWLTLITSVALAMLLFAGVASAQEATDPEGGEATGPSSDGSTVVADSDNPSVEGSGEGLVYGDINTGGASGDQLAPVDLVAPDPPAPPDISAVPDPPTTSPPVTTDGVEETTTTTTETNDGETTTDGDGTAPPPTPVDPVPPAAPAPTDPEPAVTGPSCADYATWYDAQITYEDAGGAAADVELVTALDPDGNGIACEEMMIV